MCYTERTLPAILAKIFEALGPTEAWVYLERLRHSERAQLDEAVKNEIEDWRDSTNSEWKERNLYYGDES